MIKKYQVTWKTYDHINSKYLTRAEIFDDMQWKEMFIRVKNDTTGEYLAIPYTSIYDIKILDVE